MRTIEFYADMKNRLMRQARVEKNPDFKAEQLKAFDHCDRKIGQLLKWYRQLKTLVIIVNVAVILSIFASGCNGLAGVGRDITWMGEAGQEMLEHGHEVK